MSLKDLFKEQKYKFLSNETANSLTGSGIESAEYVSTFLEDENRFIPLVDYSKPENFARFGSAEKYYYDSITRVYNTYPYDGSKKEKILWELSSSGIDLYLFENGYPRTTGYAVFSTASLSATDTSTNYSVWGSYGAAGTGTYEYVSFNGGPHAGIGSKIYLDPESGEAKYREKANVFDTSKNRECNLKIGGVDGNTVEFWLKKEDFNPAATQTEVVFDIFTTSSISSSAGYGRLTIEMSGHGATTNTRSPFYVTYMSGTSGISKQNIGSSLTTSSIADDQWHHYSFRFKNVADDVSVDLFVDGIFNHNVTTGTPINYVSGTLVGNIGALATHPSGNISGAPRAEKGWGKLSGSLDEFRFWKVWRNSQQVQTRWFDQVGGGTNTEDANTTLGLYYKFNEGITLTSSIDSTVLDYSGRLSNGSWTGYSSVHSRKTGSAINESQSLLTNFSGSEFKDPIIYSFHPDVVTYLDTKRKEGRSYDYKNPSSIYYTMPGWILDAHDTADLSNDGIINNSLWNLTQIMSSYFDNAANMMKSMPSLAQNDYFSGSQKPVPFMGRILESKGFVAPELFNAIESLEYFEDRDKNTLYTEKVSDIKNIIYKNIYNNLTFINKSKGTEKSFRNLIRCFGIDDNIYKLNIYSNNVDFVLENNFRSVAQRHRMVNFNVTGNIDATVFQYSSSLNSNSTTFISASKNFTPETSQESSMPFSVESNIVFPNRVRQGEYHTIRYDDPKVRNNYPLILTSSLFGMHTAVDTTPAKTTWNTNDYANFIVFAEKPSTFSSDAKFILTGTLGGFIPELSSTVYTDVYKDTNWSFLVSLYPEAYPNANEVSGTLTNTNAVGTNILLSFTGQAQNDRFKINVPVAAGGTGNDITIRLLEAATPSAGTANEIQVKGSAPLAVNSTATRIVAAINGSSDTSIIQYGAGSGDATNGIAGITAAIGSTPDDITITADITGSIGNSITLTDIEGTFVEDGATGASPATLVGGKLLNTRYVVEFSGISKVLDTTMHQFTVTGSITHQNAVNFLASPKRMFVGSHRTNFSGGLLTPTDVKFNTLRVWQNKLTMDDLSIHASDPNNYSIKNPAQNAYLFNRSINHVYVPNKETLLLHWNFDNVTGSDSSGEFIVEDLTSGSANQMPRYGFLSNIVNKQFTGLGVQFNQSSTDAIIIDEIVSAKPSIPEVLSSEDTIKILENDDKYFQRDSRPTFFDLYIEKSPYQNISDEMLKFMSTVVDFNNLIGQGVDRYRSEYKLLNILRQLFFQRMDAPNIDKYIEYFKWFDLAVGAMIQKLAPMSSGLDERPLKNIIESHILERNKYQSKFPTYEFKQTDPEGRLLGVNEMLYPWKEGHAPLNASAGDQSENCQWFKERAERNDIVSSGDTDIDSDRQEILDLINNLNNASAPNFSDGSTTYQGSTFALRRFARPYKVRANNVSAIHGGGNAHENKKVGFWDSIRKRPTTSTPGEGALISIEPPDSQLESFKDCDDNLELNRGKRKYKFSVGTANDGAEEFTDIFKGDLVFPFSIYSSSVTSNPAMADVIDDFQTNLAITNLHHDNYGPFNDVPMQGPFTEKYVGGRPYRHVMTNFTPDNQQPDDEGERLEGWRLTGSYTALDLVNVSVHNPKSVYFREEYAKRPVNIKNIRQLTGAAETEDQFTDASAVTKIGNYTKDYEIVMTNDRLTNNRYFVKSEGELPTTTFQSTYVSGVIDFVIPRRDLTGSNKFVIVNRFSAPGDVATMCEGMLDVTSGQYSVHNALSFRNLSVRMPLNELHSNHANQFGLYSDQFTVSAFEIAGETFLRGSSSINDPNADLLYIGTGSFHKVNRNTRPRPNFSNELSTYENLGIVSDSSSFDNFFVQHQIPQTDTQYAWITASLIENYDGSALFGFEQPDFKNASLASTDLTFATASNSGSQNIKVDFVGLNTLVIDNIFSTSNTISSSDYYNDAIESLDDALTTNAILSHRGGPAGAASWKLYKKDNHPIVRTHRSENRLSYLQDDGSPTLTLTSTIEPVITSKHKPLTHTLMVKQGITTNPENLKLEELTVQHTYLNNIKFFTNHAQDGFTLDNKILSNQNIKANQEMLDVINYYLYRAGDFAGVPELNPISELISYTVKETVFPKEQFTYLSKVRDRENFASVFWKGESSDIKSQKLRLQENPTSALSFTIPTQSIFSMDARFNITTAAPQTGGFDGGGELQNNGVVFLDKNGNHFVSPLYALPMSSSDGVFIDTAWDAGLQSGLNPSYTTYADYANEIRRIGKDYSILPEFRISEYIADYIESGFDIDARNPKINPTKPFLDLTGSSVLDATNPEFYKIYNTSDLLQFFDVRPETNDGTAIDSITMKCRSLIKFLPYDGFYPAQRTVQLASLFDSCFLGSAASGSKRAGLTPFFAPGIMYNSIKAGIAVDFPMPANTSYLTGTNSGRPYYLNTQTWKRIPFEAIINPESKLSAGATTWYDLFIEDPGREDQDGVGHTSKLRSSLQSYTFSKSTTTSPLLYTLASNNFFAETINFFLPQGKMTTLTSLPSTHPSFGFNSDKIISQDGTPFEEYQMQIRISDSPNFKSEPLAFTNYNKLNAYGLSIGGFASDYSAFVPLYRNFRSDTNTGAGTLILKYRPVDPTVIDYYDIDEIMNGLTASFVPTGLGGNNFSQHFTSSFNIGKSRILEVDFDAITGEAITVKKTSNTVEVMLIEPKWECPMLNFADVTQSTVAATGDTGRVGMWHQYGGIDENNGVFLSIADGSAVDNKTIGSLADLLGFDKTGGKDPKRLGKIASNKEISEAVVAIPFRVVGGNKVTFKIDRGKIRMAEMLLNGADLGGAEHPDQSIIDMVDKMKRYMIPPHMDFMTYHDIAKPGEIMEQIPGGPFAMYIFEFKQTLTQQDLANIWQNLPPTSIGAAPFYHESDEVTISHKVFNSLKLNLINGKEIIGNKEQIAKSQQYVEDIQWMVFKVKKRAATNYFEKTTDLDDGGQFDFKFANQEEFPNITYNWPYDFFSMVELVKLDAEVTMAPQDGSVKTPVLEIQKKYGTENDDSGGNSETPPPPETSADTLPGVNEDGSTGGPGAIDPFGQGGFGSSTGAGVMTPDGGPPVTMDGISMTNQTSQTQNTLVGDLGTNQALEQIGGLGGSDPFGQ